MTTESARDAQRQSTADLFAAFARLVTQSPDDPYRDNDPEPTAIRQALWCLADRDYPLSIAVVEEIHAERRRRLSAATRKERRHAD